MFAAAARVLATSMLLLLLCVGASRPQDEDDETDAVAVWLMQLQPPRIDMPFSINRTSVRGESNESFFQANIEPRNGVIPGVLLPRKTLSNQFIDEVWPMIDVLLAILFISFICLGVSDFRRFKSLLTPDDDKKMVLQAAEGDDEPVMSKNWSILGLIALTSYRFYTGFLSATWLPYLLAMEGEQLWHDEQSLFMGTAKLIYGLVVLTNPILGRLGDEAVRLSHGVSRRTFVRAGIFISANGIALCLISGKYRFYYPFILGIFLWRLGEAVNDVTTEALIPEMVDPSQFQLAGAIKAASFLFGGIMGYALLYFLVDIHYSWLYYSYAVSMVLCSWPALLLLKNDQPLGNDSSQSRSTEVALSTSLVEAYVAPTQYEGGFPRFALAVFVFSLGTSPMFFLLLIVRDLVEVHNIHEQSQLFSKSSLVFLLSAAIASIISGIGAPKHRGQPGAVSNDSHYEEPEFMRLVSRRWNTMVRMQFVFGSIVMLLPLICMFDDLQTRTIVFYIVAIPFGFVFGWGYTRMQEAAWVMLPAGERGRANAMGFNVMTRLLGIGLGNFLAGLILDLFKASHDPREHVIRHVLSRLGANRTTTMYTHDGYFFMCLACALCNFLSGYLTWSIPVEQLVSSNMRFFTGGCRNAG